MTTRRSPLLALRRVARAALTAPPVVLGTAAIDGLRTGVRCWRAGHERVIRLAPAGPAQGHALVAHVMAPFLRRHRRAPAPADRRGWTAFTLVDRLLARRFVIDVVSEHNTTFVPREPYSVFLATRQAFTRYAEQVPPRCLKVLHLEDCDVLAANAAELGRLVELKDRRGVVLAPLAVERLTAVLQQATSAIVQGNNATLETYAHARIPLYPVPAASPAEHPSPLGKDFDAVRRRFVWLGTRGLVHDGLDRVLEAFAGHPDIRLRVCGDVAAEHRFEAAYARELYGTSHISTAGPVAFTGRRFRTLARESVGLVFPSCADGQAAEVIAGMAAGLIPIVTREAGVDVDDCGLVLADDSIDAIRAAVRAVVDFPAPRLSEMAVTAWERARTHHGPPAVALRYDEILTEIIGPPGDSRPTGGAAGISPAGQAASGD